MTNQDRDADRLALADDLEAAAATRSDSDAHLMVLASIALRAPRRDEPVAWLETWPDGAVSFYRTDPHRIKGNVYQPLYAHPAASQGEELRDALKPFARIAVEFGASESNAFIIEHDVTLGMCRQARAALNATRPASPSPSHPAAQPMREALRHALVRFQCLADHFKETGDEALWAMSEVDAERMEKALAPASANEVHEDEQGFHQVVDGEHVPLRTPAGNAGLPGLWKAIVDSTTADEMFWIGEILLHTLTRETGFRPTVVRTEKRPPLNREGGK